MVSVRYIARDVPRCVAFYRDHLGFRVEMHPAPDFAMLSLGELKLLLNEAGAGGAGVAGGHPAPGGWNRFQIEVDDLDGVITRLQSAGATFRGELTQGKGGKQILLEDPSGNPIELFQPVPDTAR